MSRSSGRRKKEKKERIAFLPRFFLSLIVTESKNKNNSLTSASLSPLSSLFSFSLSLFLFLCKKGCADLYLNDITKISGQHGDTLLVKPQNFHSLVNPDENEKLYMLSIILPNETFAEDVWNGKFSGKLQNADVDHLVDNVSSSSSSSSSSASGSGSGGRRVLTKN